MTLLVYFLISILNACVFCAPVLLLGASQGRTVLLFILVLLLSFFMMLFVAGAAIDRKPYYLGEK